MRQLMAATAMGLALQTGEAAGATGGFGPRAEGEAVTYRLTSTESSARGTWATTGTFRVDRAAARQSRRLHLRLQSDRRRIQRRVGPAAGDG